MNRKVQSYLRSMDMIHPGEHVICAVSGGKDSMAMLHLLCSLAPQMDFTVSAAHINHRLRGEESQRDVDFVENYCRRRHIPFQLGEVDVSAYAAQNGMGIEEAARILRYDFLLGLDPNAKIATAHTANDNLETVLMHMLRGCGLHGLTGIPPVRGKIIRPLLAISQQEIEDYLSKHQIPHVEDSTNALNDHLRNRIRHQLVPWFTKENPAFLQSFTAMTQSLQTDDAFLSQEAAARLSDAMNKAELSLDSLLSQHKAIQLRMLQQFLAPVPNLSRRKLASAHRLCFSNNPSGRISLPGGYTLMRKYTNLMLLPPTEPAASQAPVTVSAEGLYAFGPWEITCTFGTAPTSLPEGTTALAASRLTAPLLLRPYRAGDRIGLPAGTKKLSDLFIDLKIPAHMRPCIPVAVVGDTIAAVLPLRTAKIFSPKPGEDCMLLHAEKREV